MREQKNTYEYQVMRSLRRKYYLISLKGGKCEKCGYDKNLAAFDFHHRDPKTKKFQLDQRTLSNNSMKVIMEEFEKCDVYCANCHREHHSPDLVIEKIKDKLLEFDERKEKWLKIKEEQKHTCEDCGCDISKWGKKCRKCLSMSRRKVDRPNIETLILEVKENGYSKTSKKYGVSDKTIKKWITNLES